MAATESIDPLSVSNPATCEVMTFRQLRGAGFSARRASRLCGPDGPWRRLHPGVVLLRNAEPDRRQRLHAAIARFGPEAVITAADALRAYGMKCEPTPSIQLLVGQDCRRMPGEGLEYSRTSRLPEPVQVDGLPFAPPVRAALDLARLRQDPAQIRAALTLPLYWGICDRAALEAELTAGNQRGSAAVRAVLGGLHDHEILAHGLAVRVLRATPLPPPSWNVLVCDRRGRPLGTADAWWDELGVAWQFRTGAAGFSHLALTATGIVLVRCSVAQLRAAPGEVARELHRAYVQAARTPRPKVRALHSLGEAA
jgi:hypothetical protein